jgi:hypothetical protein
MQLYIAIGLVVEFLRSESDLETSLQAGGKLAASDSK